MNNIKWTAYSDAAMRQDEELDRQAAEWKQQRAKAIAEAQQAQADARRADRAAFFAKLKWPFGRLLPLWTLARTNSKAALIFLVCVFVFNYVLYPVPYSEPYCDRLKTESGVILCHISTSPTFLSAWLFGLK